MLMLVCSVKGSDTQLYSVGLKSREYKVGVGRGKRNVGGFSGGHVDEYDLHTLCECMNSSKINEKIHCKES